jgi:hypothetical protein
VDRFGDEFFTATAFALDQDRRLVIDNLSDDFVNPLHARAGADDIDAGFEALFHFFLELAEITGELAAIHGAFDQDQNLVEIERLGDVIEGAAFHRADGIAHGALRGHNNHRRVDAFVFALLEHSQSINVRQFYVQKRDIEIAVAKRLPRARSIYRGLNPVTFLLERFLQDEAK